MIPIKPRPEPPSFESQVRVPGQKFLQKIPHPKSKDWSGHSYWTKVLEELHSAYGGICAYSGMWIPGGTGGSSVEHFAPKSLYPHLAYEWSNYRLVGTNLNGRKSDYTDVLDPFTLTPDWFMLLFPALLVKPNGGLAAVALQSVQQTINRLKLNEESLVRDRQEWLKRYCVGGLKFSRLRRDAPFIAYELERQNLVQAIKTMMAYELDED